MKITKRAARITAGALAGVMALTLGGVMTFASGAVAQPFDPTQDVNWIGTITFYDAAGQVVTSGDATNALSAQYMVGSANPAGVLPALRTIVALVGPQPSVNPGLWSGANLNGSTLYPLPAPAPAVVSSATTPQGAMIATSTTFAGATAAFTPNTGVLANMFQIRLKSAGTTFYNATTISVDPVTGAWVQVDPAPKTATTTTLAVTPASPATTPVNPTLTATVTPAAAGTVQFSDGATLLGAPVAVAAGVATTSVTAATVGTHSYSAAFTSTDPLVASSASAPTSYLVNAPKPTPAVALTSTSVAPNFGSPVTFTANVAPIATVNVPGTVQFFDGTTSLAPAAAADATGMATLTTSALTVGSHSVTATFVPTDLVTYNGSTSPAVTVNVLAVAPASCSLPGSVCTDAQPFVATVPAGSIVISTPYLAANPFNIGTMVLNAAGTQYTTSAQFGNAASPNNGVTITDTRAGGLGWTASLQSGAFTNTTVLPAAVINAGNLGFTGVAPQYISGNALNVAPGNVVSVFDNVAPTLALAPLAPASGLANPQKFASAAIGAGSVNVTGLFTLNAPSSVPAGLYGGTVTFTIA